MYRVVLLLVCAGVLPAQNPQALLKEAVEAQQSGNLDKAIQDYRTLLAQYPNIAEIRSNLAVALSAEGHYEEAIAEYKKALAIKDNQAVRLNMALAYYKLGDIPSSVTNLKRLKTTDQVATVLADCYLRQGQNKQVIALLTPLQQSEPDNAAFDYMLGTALVRDGQTAKGQVIVDKILRNGDSGEVHLLMGTLKYMQLDFAGARDEFHKAVDLNPLLPDVYAYYGLSLLATGDQSGARKAFERELASNPNNFESNLRLGVILRNDDQNEEALKHLQHALDVRPGDPGVRYQIAAIELDKGQLPEAERDLQALVKDSPDFLEAHVSLATVYFREKNKVEGQHEREIVAKLTAAKQQANEVGAKAQQQP